MSRRVGDKKGSAGFVELCYNYLQEKMQNLANKQMLQPAGKGAAQVGSVNRWSSGGKVAIQKGSIKLSNTLCFVCIFSVCKTLFISLFSIFLLSACKTLFISLFVSFF